uniref:Uncharacterized protein n=1 Tax=viral metagenome TaxID=1070528 RepID=A0A6M3JT82_9ZZZZ
MKMDDISKIAIRLDVEPPGFVVDVEPPGFVMLEITRLDLKHFKLGLVDKKHGVELDWEYYEVPAPPNGRLIEGLARDYKEKLREAGVI